MALQALSPASFFARVNAARCRAEGFPELPAGFSRPGGSLDAVCPAPVAFRKRKFAATVSESSPDENLRDEPASLTRGPQGDVRDGACVALQPKRPRLMHWEEEEAEAAACAAAGLAGVAVESESALGAMPAPASELEPLAGSPEACSRPEGSVLTLESAASLPFQALLRKLVEVQQGCGDRDTEIARLHNESRILKKGVVTLSGMRQRLQEQIASASTSITGLQEHVSRLQAENESLKRSLLQARAALMVGAVDKMAFDGSDDDDEGGGGPNDRGFGGGSSST